MKLSVAPGGALRGEIHVAADKSISHRAIIFGALADGITRVKNLLEGADVLATMRAFRQMGVTIEHAAGECEIHGVGLHGLCQPQAALDMGNSGTAMRLLAGVLCGQKWSATLCGDKSLSTRPMARIITPLTQMGATIKSHDNKPPLAISPATLRGITYHPPIASAQVKSCLLLAGLYGEGITEIFETQPTRDHSERMLGAFGCAVDINDSRIAIRGGADLRACDIHVPADLSSAAFFIVAATIAPSSEIVLRQVGVNPTRTGILMILKKMGADIILDGEKEIGGEPVADIHVRAAKLRGCRIDAHEVALAIDEIPAIAIAAACASGITEIRGAADLRVKESDRIEAVASGLCALGIEVKTHHDGLTINGGALCGGQVESCGDHRIAMAFAIAGHVAESKVEVRDCDNIATSFPQFCTIAKTAGMTIDVE